jgi:PTH1 family peptidyl-tRNA hydrolase
VKLVVGLGNPGPRYADTRHNVGLRVAEHFAARCGISLTARRFAGRWGSGVLPGAHPVAIAVLLPETFMNRSGEAVAQAVAGLPGLEPTRDLIVVLDDVDLPFGRLRLRPAGGAGGQKGLADVLERLGRRDVPRLRVGVDRPPGTGDTRDHVLAPFSTEQRAALPEILERASDALVVALGEGLAVAMGRFNSDPGANPGDLERSSR